MQCVRCFQVAFVPEALKPSVRVTLEMGDQPRPHRIEGGPLGRGIDTLAGSVVLPSEPRAKSGVHWGYTVRIASGLSAVFSECPYEVRCMALLPSSHCQGAGLCVWTAAHTLGYSCRARTEQLLRNYMLHSIGYNGPMRGSLSGLYTLCRALLLSPKPRNKIDQNMLCPSFAVPDLAHCVGCRMVTI